MTRKKAAAVADGQTATETTEQTAPDQATGTGADTPTGPRAEGLRRWREQGGKQGPRGVRPSYLVLATRQDGIVQVLHVAGTRVQASKWLDMAHALLLANYESVSVYRGKPVNLTPPTEG
jgi:hypothetical protein